jgi:hypothetical protein
MSPEEHELLKRSIALAEENNDILRSIKRSMRFSSFMTVVYWLIIIGISVGAWYFVQPYLNKAEGLYSAAHTELNNVSNTVNSVKKTIGQ